MEKKEEEKIDVVTTKKAAEILGCTVAWFHQKYRSELTKIPSLDNRCYYSLKEVNSLKETKDKKIEGNYKIVG